MPSLGAFLADDTHSIATSLNAFDDAETVGVRIAERPSSITVTRAGSTLSAQTVRIEVASQPSPMTGLGGNVTTAETDIIILGYKNHLTVADTNLQRDDRFLYGGRMYNVVDVFANFSDRLMARARAEK